MSKLSDPFGSFLPALLYHGLRDRMAGRRGRANARWGWLTPPGNQGKVVWIVAGRDRRSVRLGVELARALRDKRLDIRIVLTFEHDYEALLSPLEGLAKTGWGYGPADRPVALKRVFSRFSPLGIIFAGVPPRKHLARFCAKQDHVLSVAASPGLLTAVERAYPATAAEAAEWEEAVRAPTVDLTTLLTEAHVDPNFRSLVNAGAERHLWWLHCDDLAYARQFVGAFKTEFPEGVLFLSGATAVAAHGLPEVTRMSAWPRSAVPDGTLMAVDDSKWLPAVAAVATAAHLQTLSRDVLWQAMAGACVTSCADVHALPKPTLSEGVKPLTTANEVLRNWQSYRANPILSRTQGDEARRLFWQERRLAAEVNQELLQRVFEW